MPRDGLLSPRDPRRVPGQPRCPQNQPHSVRPPDCPYAFQMSTGNPQRATDDPHAPTLQSPCPAAAHRRSLHQISRKFHTPQMSTQTLSISHSPVHLRHFRRSPHTPDVHRWSPGFPDFTEDPHAPWESRWSPHTPGSHRLSTCVPEVHKLPSTLDIHRWSSYTPDVSCTLRL